MQEKEGIYTDACTDVLKEILPVADNLERALAVEGNGSAQSSTNGNNVILAALF